jgi:hypothetical protein
VVDGGLPLTVTDAAPRRLSLQVMAGFQRHAASFSALFLLAACSNGQPAATASPGPAPSPQTLVAGDYGPPPAGAPLLYMHDPNHGDWLVGLDWDGNPVTTVKPIETKSQQAPDGTLFQVYPGGRGNVWTGKFLDRLGQPLKAVVLPKGMAAGLDIWADDSRHVCPMSYDPADSSWRLVVSGPEVTTQVSGVLAVDSVKGANLSVAACSPGNDRGVVVRTLVQFASPTVASWVTDVWGVRLSDGAIVAHHSYPAHRASKVVVSADAKYIAENSPSAPAAAGTVSSEIRRVSDWSSLKTLGGRIDLFSGDDALVLVEPGATLTETEPRHAAAVLDWRSGATLWHETSDDYYRGFIAEPGGRDFAVARGGLSLPSCSEASWTCGSALWIEIILGDGAAITLPDRYIPAW